MTKKKIEKFPFIKYFPVEKYFTRPLASLIVRMIFKTSITPNQVTVLSFFFGIASTISFCSGQSKYFLLGGLLAQMGSILDCADGILARKKNRQSRYGAFLDIYLDRISDFLVLSGISLGHYFYSGDIFLLILGLLISALISLVNSLFYVIKIFKQDKKTGEAAENRGLLVFLVFVFSILNRLDLLIYSLTAFAVGAIIFLSLHFFRFHRKERFAQDEHV